MKCWKFDDHNNLVEEQLSRIPVVSDGKIVAFDWHQVTDTYRASRFNAFRTNWDTADLLQLVLDVFHQTAHRCRQFDKVIILSHIERSESNLEFLLRSTRVNRLPVDLVFVTQTRTVAGGKAAVLQALLGERNIARSAIGTLKQRADVLTKSPGVSAWDSALKLLHIVIVSLKT